MIAAFGLSIVTAVLGTATGEAPATATVVDVIDGDTVDVGIGGQIETVRLIGIDVAEAGTPCGDAVTAFAFDALMGDSVVLRPGAVDNRDRDGRLLRYISFPNPNEDPAVEGDEMVDFGGYLLGGGLAVPRYDSTDGYGAHPLEDAYNDIHAEAVIPECRGVDPRVEAESVSVQPVVQEPAQEAASQPEPEPQGNCHPSYTPCVPPAPPDLDCDDVNGPIQVHGDDPHRFDRDGDGVGCE
jgi:micrococcal nuclease